MEGLNSYLVMIILAICLITAWLVWRCYKKHVESLTALDKVYELQKFLNSSNEALTERLADLSSYLSTQLSLLDNFEKSGTIKDRTQQLMKDEFGQWNYLEFKRKTARGRERDD